MSKSVLIVDDEAHIRLLLEMMLEDLEDDGLQLIMATDGQEGLDKVRDCHPNLVFLDVMLPKINGFEVCRTIKKEWQMDDITVVLLTARGQREDLHHGREVGADRYVTKPFNPDELLTLVKEVLDL